MEKVPNDSKLVFVINILTVVYCCLLFPYTNRLSAKKKMKSCHYLMTLTSRIGMSVTTQDGSGRQFVTGPGRNIFKYRFVFLNVNRFRET